MDRPKKGALNQNLATQPNIPVRFRCKVGGEWKPLDAFSKNQQTRCIHPKMDAAHSGMTCLEHNGKLRTEFRCEGPCGLVKPIDKFSKSKRRQGDYTCERCVAWNEIQEYNVVPGPQETGHISAEEEVYDQYPLSEKDWYIFADDMTPMAPITDMAALTLDDSGEGSQYASDAASSVAGTETSGTSLPPHLAGSVGRKLSTGSSWRGPAPSSSGSNLGQVEMPPHLRSGPRSVSTATTVRDEQIETENWRRIPFNAWDPNGAQHTAIKSPTVPSSSSETTSVTDDSQDDQGKAPQGKTESKRTKRGNWPDPRENRLTRAELLAAAGGAAKCYRDPGIDRQARMNYVDYDDDE